MRPTLPQSLMRQDWKIGFFQEQRPFQRYLDLVPCKAHVAQVCAQPSNLVVFKSDLGLERVDLGAERSSIARQWLGCPSGSYSPTGFQFGESTLNTLVLFLVGLQLPLPFFHVGRRLLERIGQPGVVVLQRGQLHFPLFSIGRAEQTKKKRGKDKIKYVNEMHAKEMDVRVADSTLPTCAADQIEQCDTKWKIGLARRRD